MPESSIVVRPEPTGSASYSQSSRLQAAGLRPAISLFERAALSVPLPKPPHAIVIADYGAATGHNSLLPVCSAIAALRTRTRPEQPVLVAHTDVADNDFTMLFQTLAEDPDSYLKKDAATYASAVGRSFYHQILPSDSVTLGWSSWAIQWLSQVPRSIGDHVHVAYSADDEVRAAYARQAAADWHEFIAFRGRELRPNGRLVVLTTGVDDAGESGYRPILDGLVAVLKTLVDDGLVSQDEVGRMALPIVGRSEKDFAAPFAPKGRFENLSIEHVEVFHAPDRFWAQYQADKEADVFGAQWAAFARASVFPTLAGALDCDRADPRHSEFVDRLEQGLAARLAKAPEQMLIPLAIVVLAKAGRSG